MTFSHISDMHLGQTQYGSPEREDDMYDAFRQAIDISIKDHVEFVILAGDLFDKPKPEGRAIVTLGNELLRLREAGIPAYFVLGEHDISRVSATPVPYIYHNLGVARYIGDGTPVRNGKTLIAGFDKMRRDEVQSRAGDFERVQRIAQEHSGPSILVMHQGIMEVNEIIGELAVNDLPRSFSYYAMGHIHDRYERYFEHLGGTLAYPGSTEAGSTEIIRETGKGFFQVDASGGQVSTSWTRLDTRPHRSFSLTYEELRDRAATIASQLAGYPKNPVVKIKVSGQHLDMNEINALAGPIHDAALYCNIVPEQSVERAEIITERPTKTRDVLVQHTKKSLNDDALSEFAINELLPLLASDKTGEALSCVMENYAKFKSGGAT